MPSLKDIKLSAPTYADKIPSTGQKVEITPFRVGDEKTLLIASQSDNSKEMQTALEQVIANCVKGVEVENLTSYDIEYLFLRLRAKSVGETSELLIGCKECGEDNKMSIDISTVEVQFNENHSEIVKIDGTLGFKMKSPDFEMIDQLDLQDPNSVFNIIVESVDEVYSGEEVFKIDLSDKDDVKNLIESMTKEQFEKMSQYFETLPKLSKEVQFTCGSCEHENTVKLEGLASFF